MVAVRDARQGRQQYQRGEGSGKDYEILGELPKKNIPNGYLRLYAKVAASADEGAIIKA